MKQRSFEGWMLAAYLILGFCGLFLNWPDKYAYMLIGATMSLTVISLARIFDVVKGGGE